MPVVDKTKTINVNNPKRQPIPVISTKMKLTNPDGTVTRTGQLLLEQLQEIPTTGETGPAGPAGAPGTPGADRPQLYWRTLDVNDTAVGANIGPNVSVQGTGVGITITGILRKVITADLVIVVNVAGLELGTLTIPHTTAVQTEVSIPITTHTLVIGTPMTFDITGSDGSKDRDGIATLTVKWGTSLEAVGIMGQWMGPWASGGTYAKNDTVSWAGSSWISLTDSNTGNQPDTSPSDWDLVAQAGTDGAPGAPGADGAGVPVGGSTGQALVKLSTTDYDTGWSTVGTGTVTHTSGALTADMPVFGAGTGDIKVGTKSGTTNELATVSGSLPNGHLVVADASGNLADGGPPSAAFVPLTNKGDLLTFDTAVTRLGVGSNGQILTADSAMSTGIKWAAPVVVPLTTKGDLVTYDTAVIRLGVGSNGQVLTADNTVAAGVKWAAGSSVPLTTKGDLLTYDTALARLGVGGNGQVLTADSTTTPGVKWATPAVSLAYQIDVNGIGVSLDYVITVNSYVKVNGTQRWP